MNKKTLVLVIEFPSFISQLGGIAFRVEEGSFYLSFSFNCLVARPLEYIGEIHIPFTSFIVVLVEI
jgi:hypothetical protein